MGATSTKKRLLAAVSGAILPLVALGFIKSLVDYIKPESESDDLTEDDLESIADEINHTEKKSRVEDDFSDLDVTLMDGLEDEIEEAKEELTGKDVEAIIEANEEAPEPNETLKNAAEEYGAFGEPLVQKVETPHLPKEEGLVNQKLASKRVINHGYVQGGSDSGKKIN